MKAFLFIISILISIQANSQAEYVLKNFKYKYSKVTIDNQSYIDTISFQFQLRNKYKNKGNEISSIIFDYGFVNDSTYYAICSHVTKKDTVHFTFSPCTKGRVIQKRNKKVIFKIPFLELKIKELNYAFLSAWYFPKYHYIYAKDDELFFSRERLYFGSITSDQFWDTEKKFRKYYPPEKRNRNNYLNITFY